MGTPDQPDLDGLAGQSNHPSSPSGDAPSGRDLDARKAAERLIEMPGAMLTGAEEQTLVEFVVGLEDPTARVLEILQNHTNDLV
jgi:hypothetical protein